MIRIIIAIILFNSFVFSQNRNKEKYISMHIGEPIYLSYSMNLFKNREIRLITGFGTPDLIGFQDYSKKYNDRRLYEYYSRSIIVLNNTYLQFRIIPLFRNRLNSYCNGGLQSRMIFQFAYARQISTDSNKRHNMNVPTTTLIEFLPFLQLGLSYTTPNRKFIFGGNAGVAKNVFPVFWRLEPLVDVYCGINIGKPYKRLD